MKTLALSSLSLLSTLVSLASLHAEEAVPGIVVHPSPVRSAAVVRAESTSKPAEIRIEGKVAKSLAKALGLEETATSVLMSMNTRGVVSVIDSSRLPNDGEVYEMRGRARLEALQTIDDDSLVITGEASRLLFNYLQLGRRLSTRITDDGAQMVGASISCTRLDERFHCEMGFEEIQ